MDLKKKTNGGGGARGILFSIWIFALEQGQYIDEYQVFACKCLFL